MGDCAFSDLSDDVVLNIFFKLEDDPRHWARLACVCTKFSTLIRDTCWKVKCSRSIPSVVSELLSTSTLADAAGPPGGWAALHKLAVCCPGVLHAGVVLENSDFGPEGELGPDENCQESRLYRLFQDQPRYSLSGNDGNSEAGVSGSECSWSLINDLHSDSVFDASECRHDRPDMAQEPGKSICRRTHEFSVCKRRKICRSLRSHLAAGTWNLSRELGNKLLASRFRGDCLYICDWPGCVHMEKKRNYMLFRGVFKNFKLSRVWRTVSDGDRSKINLNCAFCSSKETWDLHSSFCLRRVFGYYDDGDPVVRAYVCENGHVSGAWADWPLYT